MARFRGRQSRRERLLSNKAAIDFLAAGADKRHQFLVPIPAARSSRKRSAGPSEHQEQSAVIDWWDIQHKKYGLPNFALFAVPNGGARDAITGARLKREGVRKGALDLILAKPNSKYAGLFLEMKVGSNKPSDAQREFIEYLQNVGYKSCVHWSADTAIAEIEAYLQ